MKLTGQNIRHVNAITHDGKVLVFGTSASGAIYYSIKRSGFEDTAVAEGAEPFGFEAWQQLRLGESVADASVIAKEQATMADADGKVLVRSVYGNSAEVTTSADAPVQIVSALNHLYVFRQAPSGKILVNRFVLDGMNNQLMPRLDVRFRRSRQRLEPQKSATSKNGDSFDNLDYRDIDGNSFFEPALELGFAGNVANGWFSVTFVPTSDSDRNRWHLFAYDGAAGKLVLHTVGSASDGLFDVKDFLYARTDPSDPENTTYRSIPGIIRRTIDLTGLVIAGSPSSTTYDLQTEQITDVGPQLVRDVTQIMLAVPVKATGSDLVKTAVLDFALAADGTLSQIDTTPDTSVILRSDVREVVTPLTLLDDIKEIATLSPASAGTIVATERGSDDQLQIRAKDALAADLAAGSKVEIRGTKSYDGPYKVLSVDGATFRVAATFQNNEAGFYEVVPEKQTGLVFNNMVVGCEKSTDGKLVILCPSHDLEVGHEVQISGTHAYDGIFPITSVNAGTKSFVLDVPFFTGKAANLTKVTRRGLRMDGNDRVATPDLELAPPSPERAMGRTLSAWVRVDAAGTLEQSLIKDSGGMMSLALGSDNKVKLTVRMSDGSIKTVTDPVALVADTWTHYAGAVDYDTATAGNTTLALCRNGVEVAQTLVLHGLPSHLGDQVIDFDGVDDRVEITSSPPDLASKSFSVELWARRSRTGLEVMLQQGPGGTNNILHLGFRASGAFMFGFGGNDADTPQTYTDTSWHHWACTYDSTTRTQRVYRDAALAVERVAPAHYQGSGPLVLGRWLDGTLPFKGNLADVRIWNRARTQAEIAQDMARRLSGREAGLLAYWPLDNRTTKDLSPAKLHGVLQGNATWTTAAYLHPQIVPPPAPGARLANVMQFDGVDDFIEVPAFAAPTSAMTVSLWARSATPTWNAFGCLASKRDSFMLHPWTGERKIELSIWVNGAQVKIQHTPADIQGWHLYTATYDGTTVRFYVDGVEVGHAAASGAIAADAGGVMYIGHDDGYGPKERNFAGEIAEVQVWSVARSQADIQAGMYRRLTGAESGLAGYWPLDRNADDLSPSRRQGSFHGAPALVSHGSAFTVGQGFSGEIGDVQVWTEARSAADVKATMHLHLSGRERGLAAYYRMGAISYDQQPPVVADFTVHGRNGVVHGDPYAGARRLRRTIGEPKMKVVTYGSDEWVAVSQRGVYEESFEFKVSVPEGAAAVDPNNADGTGQKLFAFSYRGKSSRGSKKTIPFPPASVQQSDFVSPDGVWYKATCRVVIPSGVSLMRAFEIGSVRGRWGAEATAPISEWTAIDVRKHRIRLISDAVTRDSYSDVTTLAPLPAQSQTVLDKLADMGRAESKVARFELQAADLLERIDVAQNKQRYIDEKNTLTTRLADRKTQRTTAQNERAALVNEPYNYWHKLRVKCSQKVADQRNGKLFQYTSGSADSQLFRLHRLSDGWFNIYSKTGDDTWPLTAVDGDKPALFSSSATWPEPTRSEIALVQKWFFADIGDGYSYVVSGRGKVLDVRGGWTNEGTEILQYDINQADNQRWAKDKTSTLIPSAKAAIEAKDASIESLEKDIASLQHRIDWLTRELAGTESLSSLQSQLTTAQSSLNAARIELGTRNADVMVGLTQASPATMPVIATDARSLVTAGAVLDFAQPIGALRLTESCEGNVLLTYVDRQGRLRATPYDAAADSRNATFEQWLPDAVSACADVRNSADKITLAQAVSLPASGWTCEAWVQYPLATRSDGSAYDTAMVASASGKPEAPIAVRKGQRLGVLLDGWFFDSGVDLHRTLAAGWHHLAVSTSRGTTSFHADGNKLGAVKTAQPVLRFNGSSDYIEVPAHASPTTAMTVSAWARSATATWNHAGFLVSKRDAFVLHPEKNTRKIQFYVWISGTGWRCAEYTPADIQGWHLYTGTFDGNYIRLYIDGSFAAELALTSTGTIQASTSVLTIGYDGANSSHFHGDIAEVAYWNTARGPGEVRDDVFRPLKGDESGLIGYWRMSVKDAKVEDLTTHARHGIVKGAPQDRIITTQRDMAVAFLGNASGGGSPIGRLAEVRMWNLGLSDAEVAAHARTATTGNEPGLLAYWPLTEGAGVTAHDRSAGGAAHGALPESVKWTGRTANLGNPGSRVLSLPERGGAHVQCPPVALAGKSFTFECWARRSGPGIGSYQWIAAMGTPSANQGFLLGFRDSNKLALGFFGNDLESTPSYTDTDWHHWCGTYDQPAKKQRLYCDGVMIGERTATADFTGSGALKIGHNLTGEYPFIGEIAEVRVWDRARSEAEIRSTMRRRLSGTEANLIAYYPFDELNGDNKVVDRKAGQFVGQLAGSATLLATTALPVSGADSLVTAEYSSVEVSGEGKKQALMRRFLAYAGSGDVTLVPEQRVEALLLLWIGNTQINPTLLGYIEGAPPVPSENLTREEDYDGATSVVLKQSNETSYHWQRSENHSSSFSTEGLLGIAWAFDTGFEVFGTEVGMSVSEGHLGGTFQFNHQWTDGKETSTSASSSLAMSDSLALSGVVEDKASCAAVGKRWIPKNVGYALVISGMADVFVTKLQRSGRMVSYDIRPVEGVPLDVNTITFLINPAYTLNGSLDGLVGSVAADATFHPHVPGMRAQYGSLYPASYFRLKDAYALKDKFERLDKERETFFYNFNADQVDQIESFNEQSVPSASGMDTPTSSETTAGDMDAMKKKAEEKKKEIKAQAEKRQAEIKKRSASEEGRVRAGAAFADWQLRMGNIQIKAGKRNIVNTYVWDGDGGLRTEEQSFASTIEHSINTENNYTKGGGFDADVMAANYKFALSLVGTKNEVYAMSKTLGQSKSMELTVDLSGVEKNGITDSRDNPLVPGEKVDRYRFMSFYLEGSTDHFADFFSEVVDPEWLMSNDEEARALRQARTAKPNKCWRVMHRVTYVERPALMGIGRELRPAPSTRDVIDKVSISIEDLDKTQQGYGIRLNAITDKLDQILAKLNQP
jgi:hypothetical protein